MNKRETTMQIAHGVYIGLALMIVLAMLGLPVYYAGYIDGLIAERAKCLPEPSGQARRGSDNE